MSGLNWGMIENGGAFESLVHAILSMEDAGTLLFGRPGKDGAQDARSADGSFVYQAKYRKAFDMNLLITVVEKELEKIKKYRKPNDNNYRHWENATHWVVYANILVNSNDIAKWEEKVVVPFQEIGLKAELFSQEEIEKKLKKYPEIIDVFFGHENRVLISLREAHDFIISDNKYYDSLSYKMIGRENEIESLISGINSTEISLIPVVGPGGIGKTRFLYESLVDLAEKDWRVLWGLTDSMNRSSQWFRLLNGTQKTCVALDNLVDTGLLATFIEQLSTVERRNWRIIFSVRNEHSDILRKYATNRKVARPIHLYSLSESASKELLESRIENHVPDDLVYKLNRLAQGNPGWLCLIASLVKNNSLSELPTTSDSYASKYIESCLQEFNQDSTHIKSILRWLALWGSIIDEAESENQQLQFLEQRVEVKRTKVRDLLNQLVLMGLVKCRGTNRRFYKINSEIIKQYILSDWLFRKKEESRYLVNIEGKEIIKSLLEGKVPFIEKVIQSLSELALSRLDSNESQTFLKPIFDELIDSTVQATIIEQYQITLLARSLGKADPEGALDVFVNVRESMGQDQEVESTIWGKHIFKREKLLTTLSWNLFTLSDYVDNEELGSRFIHEFQNLATLQKQISDLAEPDKSPAILVSRLLKDPRKSELFLGNAKKVINDHLALEQAWPFVGELAKALLNPELESTDWVGSWTLRFSRNPLRPETKRWELMDSIRNEIFKVLKGNQSTEINRQLWKIISHSHHSFHHLLLNNAVRDEVAVQYRELLKNDLVNCDNILNSLESLEEATYARAMWEWYLRFDNGSDLLNQAQKCEQLYNKLNKWRFQDFFRFDHEHNLDGETSRVTDSLNQANDISVYKDFFQGAKKYLDAARTAPDMADSWRFSALARNVFESQQKDWPTSGSILFKYIQDVLSKGKTDNPLAFSFVLELCRIRLKTQKEENLSEASEWLNSILELSDSKSETLLELYWNAHPDSIGKLYKFELQSIETNRDFFTQEQWFWIIGIFTGANVVDEPIEILKDSISHLTDRKCIDKCIFNFIRTSYISFLRYDHIPSASLVEWIFETIGERNLDGNLLENHDFKWMRDHSGFQATMRQFTDLIKSRLSIKTDLESTERLNILPHNLKAAKWCMFNSSDENDIVAFDELCDLAMGSSFAALYWLPKFLAQINPNGENVADFVKKRLDQNPKNLARLSYLASAYDPSSLAWNLIATPICEIVKSMSRADREQVFFSLSKNESGIIEGTPGSIPAYFTEAVESAEHLLQNEPVGSPLRNYREWAVKRARNELDYEKSYLEDSFDE